MFAHFPLLCFFLAEVYFLMNVLDTKSFESFQILFEYFNGEYLILSNSFNVDV